MINEGKRLLMYQDDVGLSTAGDVGGLRSSGTALHSSLVLSLNLDSPLPGDRQALQLHFTNIPIPFNMAMNNNGFPDHPRPREPQPDSRATISNVP